MLTLWDYVEGLALVFLVVLAIAVFLSVAVSPEVKLLWRRFRKKANHRRRIMRAFLLFIAISTFGLVACGEDAGPSSPQPHVERDQDITSPELQALLDGTGANIPVAAARGKIVVSAGLSPHPQGLDMSTLKAWHDTTFIVTMSHNLPLEGGLRFVANPAGSDKTIELSYSRQTSSNWHYSKKYTPLYVAESCFKYNHRSGHGFSNFLVGCFS